jgi:acetylornithine deacetylase/succinyl-diaminopimelate desuccinylase-like protein
VLRHELGVLNAVAERVRATSEDTLARQIAIASIASPTGAEAPRADAMSRWLSASGCTQVRRDAVGNVIARIAPSHRTAQPPVVVMAHLDTVFGAHDVREPTREGSHVRAPGISDNARGLAALLSLSRELSQPSVSANLLRPVELVATVGEEGAGNLLGARHYFDERDACGEPRAHAAIAIDGAGDSLIVHHGIASARYRVSIAGEGGHPWADRFVPNAVHTVGRVIAALAHFSDRQRESTRVTVTRVAGGESLTSIPASAWFEVDLRALHSAQLVTLIGAVRRVIERACGAQTVTLSCLGERPGGALDAMHPLVQLAAGATTWQGATPQSASASTDANIPLARGIPAITIGAGGQCGGAHSAHEWYDDTEGFRGVARAIAVVYSAACGPLFD